MIKKTHILYATLYRADYTQVYHQCCLQSQYNTTFFFYFYNNSGLPYYLPKKLLQIYRDKIKLSFDKQS
jgi:hypothetical protein